MSEDIYIFAQLLEAAGIVDRGDLDEAIKCSRRLEVSLEQALVMLKLVSLERLAPVIIARDMIAAGQVSLPLAHQALLHIGESSISFEEALAQLPAKQTSGEILPDQMDHPLAGYFIAAQLVKTDQLNQALKQWQATQVPLGRTLVVNRFISRWALGEFIDAVRLMKEGKISSKEAVNALREAVHNQTSVIQILFESGIYQGCRGESLTLVELLVMAGCLRDADYYDLEELEVVEGKNFRQIIAERQLVEAKLMELAESLFNMMGDYLKPFQAAEALRQLKTKDITLYQAIAELKPPPQVTQPDLRLGDLLVQAGITTRESVERVAANTISQTMARIGKHLLDAHLISDTSLYNALRCQSLFKEGIISRQQAIACLSCAHEEKIKLEDAFLQCKLYVPSRMQWSWL